MRYLIIHQDVVGVRATLQGQSEKKRKQAETALGVIKHIIETDPTAVAHNDIADIVGGLERLADRFEPGEEVTLLGGYTGKCLRIADHFLTERGVAVKYHPNGCIDP